MQTTLENILTTLLDFKFISSLGTYQSIGTLLSEKQKEKLKRRVEYILIKEQKKSAISDTKNQNAGINKLK